VALIKVRRPSEGGPAPHGSELSDAALCEALSTGEAWAAALIYDRVEDAVHNVLFRLLGPGEDERDDLAQSALERVFSTITSGHFLQKCSLRLWATRVAQNVALDIMRSRVRERKVIDRSRGDYVDELAHDDRTPERLAEARQRVEHFLTALSAIDRKRAEAVVLHDILENDLSEIARMTSVSVVASQSRLVRGRHEILRLLARKEQDG